MLTDVGSCLLFVGWERKTWPINNAPTYMSRYNSTKKKIKQNIQLQPAKDCNSYKSEQSR